MSANPRPWSLERQLRVRLALVTLMVTILTSIAVAFHYGSDAADLPQKKVMERAESIAAFFQGRTIAAIRANAQDMPSGSYFEDHPDAYGWRVTDGTGAVLAASSFDWQRVKDIPVSSADEWTHGLGNNRWVAGKRFPCEQDSCVAQVILLSDPANRLMRLVASEAVIHVVLPILSLSILALLASGQAVSSALKPLSQLASHARALNSLQGVEPIELKAAPSEVLDVAAALNQAFEKLQAAIEREQEFLSNAAHSLRTPLAALQTRIEVEGDQLDQAAIRKDIETITRLCAQLLNSAHSDRLVINPNRRIDLEKVITDTITRLDSLAQREGVALAYERHSAQSLINADEDAVAIALSNLIENAIQHAPPGSEVIVKLLHDPPRISVEDCGNGIAEAQIQTMPSRFARGRHAREGGAGLGLAIVSRIMQVHRGRLELQNKETPGLSATLVFSSD
jgi:two-component system, OmpR family, sensor kinase